MARYILMLEDDEDDRYITQSVFKEHEYAIPIQFTTTSQEVFAYLAECVRNKKELPALILLDYHAHPVNAVDIINLLKKERSFSHIPVIVLSGSLKKEIVAECYAAGASSFIQKPWKVKETDEKISNFFRYWFETVILP
jgi:CheY-like chemotaxis protein